MENIHNGPKCAKNYDNDILELIFLTVQLDKDQLRIQNNFYKFWHHTGSSIAIDLFQVDVIPF